MRHGYNWIFAIMVSLVILSLAYRYYYYMWPGQWREGTLYDQTYRIHSFTGEVQYKVGDEWQPSKLRIGSSVPIAERHKSIGSDPFFKEVARKNREAAQEKKREEQEKRREELQQAQARKEALKRIEFQVKWESKPSRTSEGSNDIGSIIKGYVYNPTNIHIEGDVLIIIKVRNEHKRIKHRREIRQTVDWPTKTETKFELPISLSPPDIDKESYTIDAVPLEREE